MPHQRSLLRTVGTSSQERTAGMTPHERTPAGVPMRDPDNASLSIMNTHAPDAHHSTRWMPLTPSGMTTWRLWSRRRGAIACILFVEAVAIALTVLLGLLVPITGRDALLFAVIAALGLATAESARGVERMRRRFSNTPHVNMSSVWTLSAALLTTPFLAAAVAIILYLHLWYRSWYRITGVHVFRVVFSASTVTLSCYAANAVFHRLPGNGLSLTSSGPGGLLPLLTVVVVYWAVNSGLVALAIALLQDDRSLARLLGSLLGSWTENSLEFATLCVGILAAALLAWRPWLVVLVPLPLYVLHRSVLIQQLEHAVITDQKTGLLNAASWQGLAAGEIDRARRHGTTIGLLMIDLDHFKYVNDTFGHAAGDHILRVVAETMSSELRSYDLCGRFAGEEFVVLLPETGAADAVRVADRVCQRIRNLRIDEVMANPAKGELRLSVSIGVASYPDAGDHLDAVLLAADNALFAAKDAGRDQVRACKFTPTVV